MIRAFKATTASVHNSQADLSKRSSTGTGGYSGVPAEGHGATMQRGTRAGTISVRDRLRNARISRKRAPIERVFAVLERAFRAGHVLVTTVPRVNVKMIFSCICFNLMQVLTFLQRR